MKKTLIRISLSILVSGLVIYGCKKDKKDDVATTQDTDTQTAQDNSLAEGTYNDVNNIANEAMENQTSLSTYRTGHDPANIMSACATVTLTPNVPPTPGGMIVVNFRTTPCLCSDLRYRKGIINVAYSGMYRDSATVIGITFNNYYVGRDTSNMYKVMGTKTVTNTGHNAAGHTVFSINVNGSLLNNSGQTMTWNSQRTREWIAGESTVGNWIDDEYKINGSANGTSFAGNSYSINISQALHISLNCRWIEDGKFEFTPSGKPTRYVDYGTGGCDNIATVTISGYVFNIVLP